jgi:siroheme synthase
MAGLGAAAGFGIPLTHRDDATSTLFITGHQCRSAEKQDWETLATLNSTLVFYMGVKRLADIVMCLVENGKSKDTPIAIVENATMVSQNILTSTLGSIFIDIKHKKPMTPAIIIIGSVVKYHSKMQEYLDTLPSEIVIPIGDMGFDIWKNTAVVA